MQDKLYILPLRKAGEPRRAPGHNLPAPLTSFIGREHEVAAACALLGRPEVRLLTLTGPGGSGKTRLALQVAAELFDAFPDGVYFVNLAPISDPALVVPTIASALGVKESDARSMLEVLQVFLGEKHLLLVLDNFEQVVSAAPRLSGLLAACPHLKLLVTSRQVLRLSVEHEFAVPPLSLPDLKHLPDLVMLSQYEAVALFIARAQAARPEFQMSNAIAPAVAEICARLDGLPLAIELAAARIKLLPPQALLARLGQRLAVLTGGVRDAPARQQTLRNTIDWSYRLLNAQEQRLFRQLSVFIGGCTLEAIEAVCPALHGEAGHVLDEIASLLNKNLLYQKEQSHGEPRLMMLETVREFGLACLLENGEAIPVRDAHAAYYLKAMGEIEPKLVGKESLRWLEQVEWEHDNIRGALNWLIEREQREQALRLSSALLRFWSTRGYVGEGLIYLERGIEGKDVRESIRAKALNVAADLLLTLDDFDRAAEFCQESLQLYKRLKEKPGYATALCLLGAVYQYKGKTDEAQVLFNESLSLFRELRDTGGVADVLGNMAHLAFYQGEYASAFALAEESLAFFKKVDDKWNIANMLTMLLNMASYRGAYTGSVALAKESLAIHRELGDKVGIADALFAQGDVLLNQGEYAKARPLLEDGLVISRELGLKGRTAAILFSLARVAFGQGDYAEAERLHLESLGLKREVGHKWGIALGLEELGAVAAMQGRSYWAARLVGAAAAMRETFHLPPEPAHRTNYERGIAHARTQLGEKAFARALAEGRSMTPEQALATQGHATMTQGPSSVPPTKQLPTYPAGLTAREVEVMRLIALGLTDAQVAEQLVISPRTVNWHLTSIYSKLGVSSRAAATRYAIEHHVV